MHCCRFNALSIFLNVMEEKIFMQLSNKLQFNKVNKAWEEIDAERVANKIKSNDDILIRLSLYDPNIASTYGFVETKECASPVDISNTR